MEDVPREAIEWLWKRCQQGALVSLTECVERRVISLECVVLMVRASDFSVRPPRLWYEEHSGDHFIAADDLIRFIHEMAQAFRARTSYIDQLANGPGN